MRRMVLVGLAAVGLAGALLYAVVQPGPASSAPGPAVPGQAGGPADSTERSADPAEQGEAYWDQARRDGAQPAPMPGVDPER